MQESNNATNEEQILTEFARIKGLEVSQIHSNYNSPLLFALIDQVKYDFEHKQLGSDVISLLDSHDYERVVMLASMKGEIPNSLLENMKKR